MWSMMQLMLYWYLGSLKTLQRYSSYELLTSLWLESESSLYYMAHVVYTKKTRLDGRQNSQVPLCLKSMKKKKQL